ncbi:MAG: peptidoglycan DD-metalloendopeptidase family protein, partial [Rhodanobacteraceae bacterium]
MPDRRGDAGWALHTTGCQHGHRSVILARIMHALKLLRHGTAIGAALLLAACASTPAPVANYSFGPGSQPAAATSSAQPAASSSGVQTFGLGGHANGQVSNGEYTVAPGDTLYSIAFAHGIDFRTLAAQNDIPAPYVIHPGQTLKLTTGAATQPTATAVAAATPAVAPVATAPPSATTTQTPAAQSSAPVFGPVTTQTMAGTGVAAASASSAAVPAATTVAAAATAQSIAPPPAPTQFATPTPGATRSVAGITWQWPASGKVVGGFQAGSGGDGAGLDIAGNLGDPVRAAAAGTVVYSGNGLIGYGELIIIKHNDTYLSAYGHNSKRLVSEGERVQAGQVIARMGSTGAPRDE